MTNVNGLIGGISSITNGFAASKAANLQNEISKFQGMLDKLTDTNMSEENMTKVDTVASEQIIASGRLNGDYTSSFETENKTDKMRHSMPTGFAANSASESSTKSTIDKTSKLYEKAQELESYFVKIMLSSMRSTVQKSNLTGNDNYASKMYEDMLYDELSVSMTKNAGFGLADQIYMELA